MSMKTHFNRCRFNGQWWYIKNVSVTIQSPWPITIQMHSLWYNWEEKRGDELTRPSIVAVCPELTGIGTDSVNYHNGVLSLKKETSMYGDGRWEHIYSRKMHSDKIVSLHMNKSDKTRSYQ